jgi:hypothetical protein
MEVASGDSERVICELVVQYPSICIRMPPPPQERRLHDPEANLPGLLELWTGVRILVGAHALCPVDCRPHAKAAIEDDE